MGNETTLLLHLIVLLVSVFVALRLGKTSLILLFSLQVLLANLFVIKQITLFSFHVTCSDVYTIGSILTLNLIQEYFGKKAAKEATVALCFTTLFFIAMSQAHLLYLPSSYDASQAAFATVLSMSPKIMIISILISFFIARLDVELFALLKRFAFFKERLSSRFSLLTLFTQFLDTALFTFIALGALVAHPSHILFVSFFTKVVIILSMSPALYFFKKWIPLERYHVN